MTMLKAQYDHHGPVPHDVIRAMPQELPPPSAGQVLLAMQAAPINPSHLLTMTGDYGVLPPLPAIGGSEGVGRVAALGDGVTGLSVGQLVLLHAGAAPGSRTCWPTRVRWCRCPRVPMCCSWRC